MIDERLRSAADELITATNTMTPPTRRRSATGPVLALAAAAAVVAMALPAVWTATTPDADTVPTPATVATSTADDTVSNGPATTVTTLQILVSKPMRMAPNPVIANPEATRDATLAQLDFDPASLGVEVPLATFDDVATAQRTIGEPHAWTAYTDERVWTIAGHDPDTGAILVLAEAPDLRMVCVVIPGGTPTCSRAACDIPGQAADCHEVHDTTGGGHVGLPAPIGWLVPDGTAVVGFEGPDTRWWQIPSAGAVAVVYPFGDQLTLTAYDTAGVPIESYDSPFNPPVGGNDDGDLLPGVAVDLARAFTEFDIPAIIAIGDDEPDLDSDVAPALDRFEQIEGVDEAEWQVFVHADGTTSHAFFLHYLDGETETTIWSDDDQWLLRLPGALVWSRAIDFPPMVSVSESGGSTMIIVSTDPVFP